MKVRNPYISRVCVVTGLLLLLQVSVYMLLVFLLDYVKVEPFPEHLCSIPCRFVTILLKMLLVYPILLLLVTAFLDKPVTYFLCILGMYVRLLITTIKIDEQLDDNLTVHVKYNRESNVGTKKRTTWNSDY